MSLEFFHVHLPTWVSPLIITLLLAGSSAASLHKLRQRREMENSDHGIPTAARDAAAEEGNASPANR